MILDLHLHSELSDDSRAPVEAYLKLLARKRDERPLDGIVLTEHRQFDTARDYRALEDAYGFRILTAAEVETDYGHVLVYGVNADILARFDFTDVRLPAQEVVTGMQDSVSVDLQNLITAVQALQAAAPTGHGWDATTDSAAENSFCAHSMTPQETRMAAAVRNETIQRPRRNHVSGDAAALSEAGVVMEMDMS